MKAVWLIALLATITLRIDGSFQNHSEAIVPGPELFCPLLSDARGNILGVYDPGHNAFMWNTNRPTGYGAVSGHRPPPLGHGADLVQASSWRGRWSDIHGGIQLAHRPYDPVASRFLSFDPVGLGPSDNPYGFPADPVNWDDPNGLLATRAWEGLKQAGQTLADAAQGVTEQWHSERAGPNPITIRPDPHQGFWSKLFKDQRYVDAAGNPVTFEPGQRYVDQRGENILRFQVVGGPATVTSVGRAAPSLLSRFFSWFGGAGDDAAKTGTQLEFDFVKNLQNPNFVIYKAKDLQMNPGLLRPGEYQLNLPNLGNEALNWAQNQQALQKAINIGNPIRDLSPHLGQGFLQRERDFLIQSGWKFDPVTGNWNPAK